MVARLRAAEAEAAAGESAAAAATLDGLAGATRREPVYRQLGDLLTLQRDFDQADPDSLAGRVAALTAPDAPWRHSALELEALAQLRAGDIDGARRTLDDPAGRPAHAGQSQPARGRADGRARRAGCETGRRTPPPDAASRCGAPEDAAGYR